ncbi:MAG: hypothetical protein EA357_10160 [Micavibrio sp.]|nr:MAG: hypothetical protein EA357_10160 [Micavibrio sp.]
MGNTKIELLELLLIEVAKKRQTLTYRQVAQYLELHPPNTIHQATECIEAMMRLHAQFGTPQLASLVISKIRNGLPAPGFFMLLQEIGLYDGSVDGKDAREFHTREMNRCYNAVSRQRL